MNITQLEYFLSVYDHGSYVKASENTYASRQTLGRAVAELEREFGQKLFAKQGRGITPTAFGVVAADIARSILAGVDHLNALAKQSAQTNETTKPLTVAVMQPSCRGSVFNESDALDRIRAACDFPLSFQELPCDACYSALDNAVVDAAIVLGHRADSTFAYEFLKRDKTFLAVSKNHPFAARGELSFADLSQIAIAQPLSLDFIYARITELSAAQNTEIKWTYVAQDESALVSFIEQGGAAFVAGNAPLTTREDIVAVALSDDNMLGLPFYFALGKHAGSAQAHRAYTAVLSQLVGQ